MLDKITIVGSGNVAHHLAEALHEFVRIAYIVSRNAETGKSLASKYGAVYKSEISKSTDQLILICVKDDEITNVLKTLSKDTKIAITSGSFDINSVQGFDSIATLYPLQTFSAEKKLDYSEIPYLLESNNSYFLQELHDLVWQLGSKIHFVNFEERKIIHLAAVFANNFTNHLYHQAEQILEKSKVDFSILHPLIKETVSKVIENGAIKSQTGPAIRKDQKIIDQQLEMLDPDQAKLYKELTESIIKTHNNDQL